MVVTDTRIDLHLHTTYSDGTLSPDEMVRLCVEAQLSCIAISDHDTIAGIPKALAAGKSLGIEVIPAIEMSTGMDPEIHILGYYPDLEDQGLHSWLEDLRNQRAMRTARIVARLREREIHITLEDIQAQAAPHACLGRMHVALALVHAGYVKDIQHAFAQFLVPGKPGYIPRDHLPVAQMVRAMRSFGMIPVLAHGAKIDISLPSLIALIKHMKEAGLMGLECYHTSYTVAMEQVMLRQAKSLGLLVTGGSDYHGENRRGILPGDGMERWKNAEDCLNLLKNAKESCT